MYKNDFMQLNFLKVDSKAINFNMEFNHSKIIEDIFTLYDTFVY